jgi:hypothetical protein
VVTEYPPGARLRLIATTRTENSAGLRPYSSLEIAAAEWSIAGPERRDALMQAVVNDLTCGAPDPSVPRIRSIIWDGSREIPYRSDWPRPSADRPR